MSGSTTTASQKPLNSSRSSFMHVLVVDQPYGTPTNCDSGPNASFGSQGSKDDKGETNVAIGATCAFTILTANKKIKDPVIVTRHTTPCYVCISIDANSGKWLNHTVHKHN
eukprot:TRINITY_DN53899_c0_g1_i2.p1 TRINITY_DN53899_c0_g1~~TRINITY_DN53899_c0_g1_i2.p1  ORF type:complete len:111 (-),score=13.49 TRINITY_DN53899_c0_g1_i2:130-462(-)